MKEYNTETGTYVLVDSQDRIVAKADVPPGTHPVPDDANLNRSFDVDDQTDLSAQLPAEAIGNKPDPAETAFQKLAKVVVHGNYKLQE